MQVQILSAWRDELVAVGVGVVVTVGVLIGIAIVNNSWKIWDTGVFCGSFADFQEPPVPEVCLSFLEYLRLSLGHLPHIGPSLLIGGLAAVVFYYRSRLGTIIPWSAR